MNFAIEVPAEANPLTAQNLFRILLSASSNNQQQVRSPGNSAGFYALVAGKYVSYPNRRTL